MPGGSATSHQTALPIAASIDWPAKFMTSGLALITKKAKPACPMAKLTRSLRPAAEARAARNTPLTAAMLAAPEVVRMRAIAVGGCEGDIAALRGHNLALRASRINSEVEIAAPCSPTLGATFALRRCTRRQPARPRSSRVGSKATAMAAAKSTTVRRLSSH